MISGMVTLRLHPAHESRGQLVTLPLFVGIDVGRHVHPTHVAMLMPDFVVRDRFYQVGSIWFDDETYPKQVEVITAAINRIPCGKAVVLYDNTRGEYGVLAESGGLPRGWHGFVFTAANKKVMASRLLVALDEGRMVLLDDRRQREGLLAVDSMLHAAETEAGHGESFASLMLALEAAEGGWGRSVLERYVRMGRGGWRG